MFAWLRYLRQSKRLVSLAAALLLWQVLIGTFQVINPTLLPAPLTILETLYALLGTDQFVVHIENTVRRMAIASVAASVVGVLLGLAMGWNSTVKALSFPMVSALYPLPKISILPLLMLIFGIGEQAYIITIAIAAVFLVMFNAMRGVDAIGTLYFDVATDYGVDSTYKYFKEVLIPGALPMIFTGLRLTLSTALLVTISVEFVAAREGLGAYIWTSWNTFQTAEMYAAVLLVMLGGVLITFGLEWLANRMIPWRNQTGASTA